MTRSDSIFELDPSTHEEVERGFELDGSNLSGVSGRCSWSEHDYFSEKSCKTSRSRLGSFHDAFLGNNIYSYGLIFQAKRILLVTLYNLTRASVFYHLNNQCSKCVIQNRFIDFE